MSQQPAYTRVPAATITTGAIFVWHGADCMVEEAAPTGMSYTCFTYHRIGSEMQWYATFRNETELQVRHLEGESSHG